MGWICPRCGSENLYSDGTCAACLKSTSKAWRLVQRFRQSHLKAQPYEQVQARRSASLSGMQLMCRHLLRLNPVLVAACMLCVALDVLPSLGGAGWTRCRDRLEAKMTRVVSSVAETAQSNAARLLGETDTPLEAAAGAGSILAGAAKRIEAGGSARAEKIALKLSGINPDELLLSQRSEAIGRRISSMDTALRLFLQRAKYAVNLVRKAVPFL